jgi:hypothetical protein
MLRMQHLLSPQIHLQTWCEFRSVALLMAQLGSQRESPGGAVLLSNTLFRYEVQSDKDASDKHKQNEALTFNQEVMGSNPIALTIKINELRHFPRLFAAGHPAPVSAR